jgi:probable HAF family extracellular repeat protein
MLTLITLIVAVVTVTATVQGGEFLFETVDLGHPVDSTYSSPFGINNRGDIVGVSFTADERARAFLWTARRGFELLAENGVAWDINNREQVAGERYSDNAAAGFVWTRTTGFLDLGEFIPYAINHAGVMAGVCTTEGNPCRWADGMLTSLSTGSGFATDINARGDVVGSVDENAYLWTRDGETIDLGPGTPESINNRGLIGGFRRGPGGGAVTTLWTRDGILPETPGGGSGVSISARGFVLVHPSMVWDPRTGASVMLRSSRGAMLAFDMNERGDVVAGVETPDGGRIQVWRVRPRDLSAASPN